MRIGGNHDLQNWGGRTRTYNFLINSQAICQLIYTPSNKSARRTEVWRALGIPYWMRDLTRPPGGEPIIRIEIIRGEHHEMTLPPARRVVKRYDY